MAITINYEKADGSKVPYWRVGRFIYDDRVGAAELSFYGYLSEELYNEGKQPADTRQIGMSPEKVQEFFENKASKTLGDSFEKAAFAFLAETAKAAQEDLETEEAQQRAALMVPFVDIK